LHFLTLTITNFRNLEPATTSWDRGVNMVLGSNGQGKTNLLEALTVAGNLRSFRRAGPRAMVCHGTREYGFFATLEGTHGQRRLEQRVAVGPPRQRELLVDGRPASAAQYLSVCPVFSLTAADSALAVGVPPVRRAYLDRCAFLLDANTLPDLRAYLRALRQRNAALGRQARDDEVEAWDGQLAKAGARVISRRVAALGRLTERIITSAHELAGTGLPELEIRYLAESWLVAENQPERLEEAYRKRYNATRVRDRHAGFTLEGPHRHDLRILAAGRPARDVLSSGQTKVVAAALRLASVALVEEIRGERFPLVIDDVDAELDRTVLTNLARSLVGDRQLFVSSAGGDDDRLGMFAGGRTHSIVQGCVG
jgi:DNA replication and repair protein RecF